MRICIIVFGKMLKKQKQKTETKNYYFSSNERNPLFLVIQLFFSSPFRNSHTEINHSWSAGQEVLSSSVRFTTPLCESHNSHPWVTIASNYFHIIGKWDR